MLSFVVSLALAAVAFAVIAVLFDPLAAIVPAVMVFGIAVAVILLRVKRRVDAEIQGIVPMLQGRRIRQAQEHLESVRDRYAKWMPLLDGQVEGQLGMIDYFQMNFDEALPKLEKGSWRNWMALGCIGAIHFRQGRHDEAWEALDKALDAGKREPMAYTLYAVLLHRAGERDRALEVLNRGLDQIEGNQQLQELKSRIANKKKVKTGRFGQAWYQFFPEDLAQSQLAQGRGPRPGPGFRPNMSKQMYRGR